MASKQRERPRPWLPLDIDFLAQDSIRELGQEFGPDGPMLLLAIITEAKRYALGGAPVAKQGTVSMRYRAAATSAFLTGDDREATAKTIVELCVSLGLLERLSDDDPARFHVRLLKWDLWEPKDVAAADRKRRSRETAPKPATEDDAQALDW